ncbi:MAG TPA: PKD domain-containing protein, partial [Candidatus Competibacteraceae bacterium]|nr:PKD domain-containing protein [Candidatus Competibacteraceae bacterium]
MALARASLQWISGLVLLALVLSGWVLRTESAGSGGMVSADVSGQVAVKFSGLLFNRVMQTFDTVATVTNISSDTILAPLELHLASITPTTVTLHNPSGTASDGHPYIAVPLPTGTLAPGATVTNVVLRFRNPSNVQFSFTHPVMGMVAARNTPPIAGAGPDQSAQVGTTVTLDGSHSTDADGDALTYDWTLPGVPAGSTATLADPATIHPRLTLDKPGSYTAQLVVNDGQAASAPDTVTISTENTPPVAKAGPDQSAPVTKTVTLDGSGSSDVDGNPLTFQWTVLTQPDGSTAALVNPTAVNPRLTLDRAGSYTVQLLVNDGHANSAPDSVTISTENSKPVAEAGPAQTVPLNATVQLSGAGSHDADGDALTYQWTLTTVPVGSTATLTNPTSINPTLAADKAGAYVAQLIVNDGTVHSDPDTVTISTENSKPVADAGPDQQVEAGDTVILDGSGSSDADGDVLSYQWALTTQPVGSTATLQDADQAQAQFIPDFAGSYIAQLIVHDGLLASDPDTATVTVTVPPPTNRNPQITSSPVTTATVGQAYSYDVNATDADGDTLSYVLNVAPADMNMNASTGLIAWMPTAAGSFPVTVEVRDGHGGRATQSFNVQVQQENVPPLPPAPETVAPPVDATVATTTFAATEFLYTGANPIQTGVAPGTIEPKRAAVLRGRVLDKDNNPLPAVVITVLNHPEFGQTLSRADGWFDLAVNGGGYLTLNYQRVGYLPAQRQVNTPWQDFVVIEEVVLIPQDPQVATVDLTNTTDIQVARGSVVTDQDGTRQATLLIPPGTQAQVYNPDGTTRSVTTLTLRATEYTVGENGPKAMPAPLPPTSGYTYAVELSVEEATIKIAGKDVLFNQPVPFYVDNFLNMPVGIQVPVGYYDKDKSAWIPADDGRVIKIVSIANGLAELDTDGDNAVDNGASLGVTDAERRQLASLYTTGKTLWRVPLMHLSTKDFNAPRPVPPNGASNPSPDPSNNEDQNQPKDPSCENGSIIQCESQTLIESVDITGMSFDLNYASDRVLGRQSANTLNIPLSGANVPSVLKRIDLEITVAGQVFKQSFSATANQSYSFTWDGRDAYGRSLLAQQPVTIRIGYVYDAVYAFPPAMARTFGLTSGVPSNVPARQEIILWQEQKNQIGPWNAQQQGLGGWALGVHHAYDPIGKILYLGNGGRRNADKLLDAIITNVAGTGVNGYGGDGGPATAAQMGRVKDVVVGSDGSLFISEVTRVRRVKPDGTIETLSPIVEPEGLGIGPDNRVYFASRRNDAVYRVEPNHTLTRVAGNQRIDFGAEGIPAVESPLYDPSDVAVAPDGTIYIAESGYHRIRRVSPDGLITTVAGNGTGGFSGDGGPATAAQLQYPESIALGADGSLYISDTVNNRIRKVGPDGVITTVAGDGGFCQPRTDPCGDGGPAVAAKISFPFGLAVGDAGDILIVDGNSNRIRRIRSDGVISTLAGTGVYCPDATTACGDQGPATGALLNSPDGVAVGADGKVYIADDDNHRVRAVSLLLPGAGVDDIVIAAEGGGQLYRFDFTGRHLSTLNALTGAIIYQFGYDNAGRLVTVTDGNGNVTTLEQDASGNPLAIVAPFGQRTTLNVNSDGYLASISNPANETYRIEYTGDGLLSRFIDPKGNASTMVYDVLGRLLQDNNAAGGSHTLARTE